MAVSNFLSLMYFSTHCKLIFYLHYSRSHHPANTTDYLLSPNVVFILPNLSVAFNTADYSTFVKTVSSTGFHYITISWCVKWDLIKAVLPCSPYKDVLTSNWKNTFQIALKSMPLLDTNRCQRQVQQHLAVPDTEYIQHACWINGKMNYS